MKRITNKEIAELKRPYQERVTFHDSLGLVDDESPKIIAALDRLGELEARNEVLEAAVAFKGFDEVPKTNSVIEGRHVNGCIIEGSFEGDVFEFDHGWKVLTSLEMKEAGFIGWRYPVGDLS